MTTPRELVAALAGRLRTVVDRSRTAAADLQPATRTALRVPGDRVVPAPGSFARFGDGSALGAPARLRGVDGIEVGRAVTVLEGSGIHVEAAAGARLVLEDSVQLGRDLEIVCTTSVMIGEAVAGGDRVAITDAWGLPAAGGPSPPPGGPVTIGRGAYLGTGCTVGPAVTVGEGAYVGEGAVVVDDVPPHTAVFGNPARVVAP